MTIARTPHLTRLQGGLDHEEHPTMGYPVASDQEGTPPRSGMGPWRTKVSDFRVLVTQQTLGLEVGQVKYTLVLCLTFGKKKKK